VSRGAHLTNLLASVLDTHVAWTTYHLGRLRLRFTILNHENIAAGNS
jgi:hypothetical protein